MPSIEVYVGGWHGDTKCCGMTTGKYGKNVLHFDSTLTHPTVSDIIYLYYQHITGVNHMKSYKAAIFDLDGTLLDTLDDLHAALNHTMDLFSYPHRTREEVRQFVGNGVARLMELSVPGGADDENFERAIEEYRKYYTAHSEVKTKPYDGVTELIRKLKADGIGIAVASNKPHKATCDLCAKMFPDIEIVSGEREADGIKRKPAPDMVIYAAGELGCSVDECVYIGDSEVDVKTAKNAGMDVVAVLWGFRDRDVLENAGAEVITDSAQELYRLIRKI